MSRKNDYRYRGKIDISKFIDGPGTDPVGETPTGVYDYGVSEEEPVAHGEGASVRGTVHFNPGSPAAEIYIFNLTTSDDPKVALARLRDSMGRALRGLEITASYPERHSNSDPTRVALQEVFTKHYEVGCTFDDANKESGYRAPAWTTKTN